MMTLGTDVQAGHVDFYPNGGIKQPGVCGLDPSGTFNLIDELF